MRLRVATMWFCEEGLAPLFLRHYDYADEVVVLLDADTTDGTLGEIRKWIDSPERHAEVEVFSHRFPRGLDDEVKSRELSAAANRPGCDFAIVADADEFVFAFVRPTRLRAGDGVESPRDAFALAAERPPAIEEAGAAVREVLEGLAADVAWIPMWNVYRHADDADIDPRRPPLPQRRRGSPRVHHAKPCAFRIGAGVEIGPGGHSFTGPTGLREVGWANPGPLGAAHWQYADPDFAVPRLVRGRARLSPENLARGHGVHYLELDEAQVRAECARHLDDPQIF